MVNDEQVKLLRQERMDGKMQRTALAGMCERTARTWEKKEGLMPSETKKPRTWRTRQDPFAEVWESFIVPLLEADKQRVLRAPTLLAELQELHPGQFEEGQLRTLQRRICDWRAVHGPDQEVYFPQEHPPGREAAVDFTHADALEVTIGGQFFAHLLFALKLSFSGWTWVQEAFSETFEALVRGLQGALWDLGGVPEVVRHDNLSAATHELKKSGGRKLTQRFRGVLDHYGLKSTRIRPRQSHENGVIEKGHDLVKGAVAQALVLRGSREFASVGEYEAFVRGVVDRRLNGRGAEKLAIEREQLRALPPAQVPSYTTHRATVRRWSTIRVSSRTYSVPSRLIGHEVGVRQHPEHLDVYYKDRLVETLPRLVGDRTVRIDYRHVIWSLVRKPGAFERYRHREELLPSLVFRRGYDALVRFRGERYIEYVRILYLAASTLEGPVERALAELLATGEAFDYAALKALAKPGPVTVPTMRIPAPDLGRYDALLRGAA